VFTFLKKERFSHTAAIKILTVQKIRAVISIEVTRRRAAPVVRQQPPVPLRITIKVLPAIIRTPNMAAGTDLPYHSPNQ
jgi:hypothetical protein